MSSEPSGTTTTARGRSRTRVTELVVLIESVLLAIWSLTWLSVATAQSHMDRVRWELWVMGRGRDLNADESIATSTAVLISFGVLLTIVAVASLGYLTALRRPRGQSGISVPTRVAALLMFPLTVTLPIQFAAFQQTQGWVGDNHGLELMVKYGAFVSFLVGIGLLMGTKELVDSW